VAWGPESASTGKKGESLGQKQSEKGGIARTTPRLKEIDREGLEVLAKWQG